MDEATKQALNAFVQQMITAANNGAQWTAEQAPIVVQEWLRWQLAENAITAVGLFIALVASWRIASPLIKMLVDSDGDPFPFVFGWVIRGLAVLFFGCGGFVNLLAAIKVYVAPRVVVLEKFMELVK